MTERKTIYLDDALKAMLLSKCFQSHEPFDDDDVEGEDDDRSD